jgi:hypothetical protein
MIGISVTLSLFVCLLLPGSVSAADKLLQAADFTYLGAFRVPQGDLGGPQYHGLSYGGSALAYNPARNSLFIVGHDQDQLVAEISIPSPVVSSDPGKLNRARLLQKLADVTKGNLTRIKEGGAPETSNKVKIGGLLVYGDHLVGTAYNFYDGARSAVLSHFKSGTYLAAEGNFQGMYQVGSQPSVPQAGFVAGYMGNIPAEYRSALGGSTITGQAGISIVGRTSWGPAAFAFEPGKLGIDNPVTATPLVYYPLDHQTLGRWGHPLPPNPHIALGDTIAGVAFPTGTRSIIFTGKHGQGSSCYGVGGATDPGGHPGVEYCHDPNDSYKGTHSWPYVNQVWAYDVNEFLAVSNGQKKPWEVLPYAVWSFPLPTTQQLFTVPAGASAYDEINKRLYLVQPGADNAPVWGLPLVHVFRINTATSGTGTDPAKKKPIIKPETDALRQDPSEKAITPVQTSAAPRVSRAPSAGSACNVPPLPMTGTRIVNVSSEPQLQSAMAGLQAGDTIVLAKGTYNLSRTLYINGKENVTIRGISGCDDVVLVGKGMNNAIYDNAEFGIWTNSSNTSVAHLTIRDTYDNEIMFNPGAQSPHVYSVKLLNAGSQFIKSNPTDRSTGIGVNNAVIEYCWFEYTNGTPNHPGSVGYTNGISAHAASGWTIRGNLFKNLHTPDTASYLWNPAVLMWSHSKNTITENNVFINVDRAVAYGIQGNAGSDHTGGVIRNNFVYLGPGLMSASRRANSDGAIIVWDSPGSRVYHNTILTNGNVSYSIEFRFLTTGAEARNNLADAPIHTRGGAVYARSDNYLDATSGMFVDPASGNLRLRDTAATRVNVIGKAAILAVVPTDIDGNNRSADRNTDIGADELGLPMIARGM